MKFHRIAQGLALAALLVPVAAMRAEARNPHCSGGILYVTQGMRDKDKGDRESYERQMKKAVLELQQCASEDPGDAEALGYLAWAYAEVESAGPAGKAFADAIAALQAKGDRKKVDWATGNRNSYWARAFNDGIGFRYELPEQPGLGGFELTARFDRLGLTPETMAFSRDEIDATIGSDARSTALTGARKCLWRIPSAPSDSTSR